MYGFGFYATLSLIVPILALAGVIFSKMRSSRNMPAHDYTPFDNITGQASAEFSAVNEDREPDTGRADSNKHTKRTGKSR